MQVAHLVSPKKYMLGYNAIINANLMAGLARYVGDETTIVGNQHSDESWNIHV